MQKIIIIGATGGVTKAIEEIRSTDRSSEITFLALDGQYPYQRDLFAQLISKEATLNQVLCKPKDFYEKQKVRVVLDKKITKINFKKHKITTEGNEAFEYDLLLITDPPDYRFPAIKGIQRKGVVGIKKLKDILEIMDLLSLTETIIIQSNQLECLSFVSAFLKRNKEVIVISANKDIFSPEEEKFRAQGIEEKNLRFIYESAIAEILGETDVKAVRLESGKVMAAQLVIFPDAEEDFKLFADSPLKINKRIRVNTQFKTNIDNVLATHEACELESNKETTA